MIQELLDKHQLTQGRLSDLLETMSVRKIDYADLYFQHALSESWALEDGVVKDSNYNVNHGVGARAVSGVKSGFAYADDFALGAIEAAVNFANEVGDKREQNSIMPYVSNEIKPYYEPTNPIIKFSSGEKINFLKHVDNLVRKEPRVKKTDISLSASYNEVMVVSTHGVRHLDRRPMASLIICLIVEDGRIERISHGRSGRYSYEELMNPNTAQTMAEEAIRQALVALKAKNAPAGLMPVVLGPGAPGVLLHEAIGHGLEGDFNRKGSSVFTNKIGEKVAHEKCSIVDNGTLPNRRGSLSVDDEGTPTQNTVLIENGILKGYLFDKLNANAMGVQSTGNARRESYAHLPMPRMTNTYMLAGSDRLEDMIGSIDFGLYAVNFNGGQVDITSGEFVFSTSEAYLVKNGKIAYPVKGATLIGSGDKTLKEISMVGDDLKIDGGVGVCGKGGQSVPVCVGQPSVLIDNITVGGTEVS